MNEIKELASTACKSSKTKINLMLSIKSQQQVNFSEYQSLLNYITKKDQETDNYLINCSQAKVGETQSMMRNLRDMGRVLMDFEECRKIIDELQEKLISLEETIIYSLKITKYAQGYEECLKEIARRKNHSNKVIEFVNNTNETLSKQREMEISKRLSFRRSFGDSIIPKLMPFLVKSEEEEKSLPLSTFNLSPFDNDLPDVEVENVEDEFSFVVIEDPSEKVKNLEKENAFLSERLSLLVKTSTNNSESQNLRSMKRLQEAEKEINSMKEVFQKERKEKQLYESENNELRKRLMEINNSHDEKMKKLEDDLKKYESVINLILEGNSN